MKTINRRNGTWAALAGLGTCVAATPAHAGSASATSVAKVQESIQFALLLDMDFGTILANAAGGTVTLDAAGPNRSCSGPGLVCIDTFSRSRLEITGADAMVRVSWDPVFTLTGPGTAIPVQPTSTVAQNSLLHLSGGIMTVDFGAVLTVNPNQTPGTYNGVFSVNVNYE